jgi:uncharacterized protein YbjT (DUF2867 family)
MKIIVTGSLGHISQPLTKELVQKGHQVTVISSKPDKQSAITDLGATPAIGSLEDVPFLTQTFTGADAVYVMIPPPPTSYFDHSVDLPIYIGRIAENYAKAIQQSGVKRIVHLSSIGAHLEKGTGLILEHRQAEHTLGDIPGIDITYMRPTSFHYNLLAFIPLIKSTGIISSNYGGEDMVVWVAPVDIAAAIADEIVTPVKGKKVRYVGSDELTCNEVASILGTAIGKPDLKWITIPNEDMQSRLETIGMNPSIAAGLVEMQSSIHDGVFFDDYFQHRPVLGKTKMTDFAKEFAAAFQK